MFNKHSVHILGTIGVSSTFNCPCSIDLTVAKFSMVYDGSA